MQYWINHNGVQSGPVDADGIKELALTSRAYVWHPGLTDWVKITQVPELQGLFVEVADDAVVETPPIPSAELHRWKLYLPAISGKAARYCRSTLSAMLSAFDGSISAMQQPLKPAPEKRPP